MTARRIERFAGRAARRITLAVASAVLVSTFLLFDSFPSRDWEGKKVAIPKGSSLVDITSIFTHEKALPHPLAFRGLVLLTGTGRRLHYGEYTFPTPPSAYAAWRKLVEGDVVKYPVIVRPGANLFDVAAMLGAYQLAEPAEFLKAAGSKPTLSRLGISADSAEGYLVPDTYNLVKNLTPEEILEIMVRPFREKFTPAMEQKAAAAGLSVHEVLTIASIIEKETGIPGEKPLISAVIRRRLALGMPLQMDPTVIYGVKRFDGTVTRKDLQAPGPYNTYLNRGLPPGPIANPGALSIEAALKPADAEYLYFVSNNDGTHTFSKTLPEHARAVENLRRVRREGEKEEPPQAGTAPATPPPLPSGPS
ncbi:MAG: yceG [Deltaproteobacteria bacterium]|nr:yceG [Deltaproteobacteria bacterium]